MSRQTISLIEGRLLPSGDAGFEAEICQVTVEYFYYTEDGEEWNKENQEENNSL